MNSKLILIFLVFCTISKIDFINACKVSSNTFITRDATIVNQIGYIAEFTLNCGDSQSEAISLFAEYEGRVTPLARVGKNQYQLSWIEEINNAKGGNVYVRLFDEDGFAKLKKAQRNDENVQSVKSIADLSLSYPGSYKGPWVNSEVVAIGIAAFIAYFALATRSKLVS